MANITTLTRINAAQIEGNLDSKDAAKDLQNMAVSDAKKQINEQYNQTMREAEEEYQKAKDEQMGSLFGTIFGGPLIGTLIGQAIGKGLGEGNGDAARDAKLKAGIAEIHEGKADDRLMDATESLQNANTRNDQVEKFTEELRGYQFTGIV